MNTNDYELVSLAQEGNEDAINLIYQKYKPIIIKKSKNAILQAPHHGIDINDIMQEGYIGLEEAIRNFSQNNEATFYTFAMLCVERQIVNYMRKTTGGKDKILNEAVTLDDTLAKLISDKIDIESAILGKTDDIVMIQEVRKSLTTFEREVFDMRIRDYTIDEIANKLNKDAKSIYNTLQRIKLKIKKNIQNDD